MTDLGHNKIRVKDIINDYLEFDNVSKKEFASRCNITEKHLIDILSGKQDPSLDFLCIASKVINVPIESLVKTEYYYQMDLSIDKYINENKISLTDLLNRFSYNYLIKNKYIDFKYVGDKYFILYDILDFLRVKNIESVYNLNTNAFYKSKNDKFELLVLWLEKCIRETKNQNIDNVYNKDNIDQLVSSIRTFAKKNEFNKDKLIKLFNNNGIYLSIVDDIPGSKIRGAFKVLKDTPAIFVTTKHKRIADIYFSLLHEIGHLKSDFNKAKGMALVDKFTDDIDDFEEKADKKALNFMVDDKYYNEIVLDKDYDISKEKIYPKSFVVYRLAYDKHMSYSNKIYQTYNVQI